MKKYFTFLLICLCCFRSYSQDADTLNGRDKKTESKIDFIEYKYSSGAYKEAIQSSKSLVSKLEKKSDPRLAYLVQAKILQAYSFYASLQFDKASTVYKEALNLIEKNPNRSSVFESYLLLADYLQETGDLVSSLKHLKSAESLLGTENSIKNKYDLNLSKAKVLIRQGFLNDGLKLLEDQSAYRLEMASSMITAEENKEALQKKIDFKLRKEKYAELIQLKTKCLLAKGLQAEAQQLMENNKAWVRSNLGSNHTFMREIFEAQGAMNLNAKNYDKASVAYTNAYVSTPFSESEKNKIKDLSSTIVAGIYAGETVKYKNYLRRLEMYASRSVGSGDPFQLAFEYTEAYKSYIEGDYTAAVSRLNRLAETFDFLPAVHSWNLDILELKEAIALKSGDVKTYKESVVKLLEIKQKYYGGCPAFHKSQLAMALYEIHYGKDFAAAEKIMRSSYQGVLKNELTKESKENIDYLAAYGELFAKTDQYDSAMVYAGEAAEMTKNIYTENSAEYLLELAQYTEFEMLAGKYNDGLANLQKLTVLSSTIKGGNPDLLQMAYMVIAKLYNLQGEYDKSQSLLNKAYKLTLSGYEKQALTEAETSEQMASLYLLTGNYYRAEKALIKSLEVKEAKLEKNSPLIIHTYQELARLNLVNGNYAVGEQYLKRAFEITSDVFGKKSLRYSECLLIHGEYYLAIGDFKKAEDACMEADAIEVKKGGKDNLRRAEILSKLALIRSKISAYSSSEIDKLYTEAAAIIKKSLGTENPLYSTLIQKQAEFYINIHKTDQADQLLGSAEKFWSSRLGSTNRYVAEIEFLRGNIAYSKSKYDQAEKNYLKARSIYGSVFDENHPWYIQTSGKLARVYYMKKTSDKALDIMEGIIPQYLDYIVKYFPSLSFREKSKFWNNIKEEFEFYNFIALCVYNTQKPKLSASVYDNIISTKALLLSSNIKIRETILSSKDSILVESYNEWISQKEYLTSILSLTKQQLTDQNIDIKFIENHVEHLEKEISNRSELFSGEEKKQNIHWKDIKATLGENEYAVEITRVRYFDKIFTDSIIYAALIISGKTTDHPETVIFPNGELMERKYLKIFRNAAIMKAKDESSYNAYWKPLKSVIPDGATVYLSSDGVYNQLNVEMMLNPEGDYVIDKNNIVSVTNTKDLLNQFETGKKKNNKENKKEVAGNYILCGNPDFYTGEVKVKEKSVVSLPGAEKEVIEINKLLNSSGKSTVQFLKEDITEDTLRYLKNPKVFHIATHGFFKEQNNSGEDDLASNPLLNSGLVLYGGGDILNHPENNYVNMKQGILTAYEAMNLNFDKTELVVLSACETGRGEVQIGEGVYGLQRSFLIAGADAVIMTLFKVNDEVTQKLMLLFYQKWLKTGDKRGAFMEAKKEIKQQYPSPVFWGAFIMIEGKPQRKNFQQP